MSIPLQAPLKAGLINTLLTGSMADPDGGAPLRVPIRSVVIGDTLDGRECNLIDDLDFGRNLAVVYDPDTGAALGNRVHKALGSRFDIIPLALPAGPHADMETVERLRPALQNVDAVVAVGSGTINDLCKYAAFLEDKPYAVFATAPSMNGYSSVNAAITDHGHKKSLPARAPEGVFMDLSVLAAAPPRMIRSGLGDSICRPTAQADWLLAHLLLDQPYRAAPFVLLAEDEEGLLAEPEALLSGDLQAMGRLARTLVLSGFGMCLCGGSQPASQGEHLISHYADMMGNAAWPQSFHGEQIGVTALTMARLQERMLRSGPPRLAASAVTEDAVLAHFGPELGSSCWQEFARKRLDEKRAEKLNARLTDEWDAVRARIEDILIPSSRLHHVLQLAGAPTTTQELGWPTEFYGHAVLHAREIRNRYTFLDLAGDSGLLATWNPTG